MEKRKRIAVLCTLDTKSEHAAFVARIIEDRGHAAVLIDIGVLGEPGGASGVAATITRRDIADAAGANLDALVAAKDRGSALAVMAAGAAATVTRLERDGALDGVIGLGGGSGTAVASAAMRALPVGFPKVMISTMPQIAAAPLAMTLRRIGFIPIMSVIVLTMTMSRVPT